jgi:predicted nucleic acid-binding protein
MDRDDANHRHVREWMETIEEELSTTPLIVAELDYLVARQGGPKASRLLRKNFDSGAYLIEWWATAIHEAIAVAKRHESMELGLADASLVVLAAHLDTIEIATLDERRFRALKPLSGGKAFRLLPADSA